jgi:hypothetical protein
LKLQDSVAVEYQERLIACIERVVPPESSKQRPVSLDARYQRYDTIAWVFLNVLACDGTGLLDLPPLALAVSCELPTLQPEAERSGDVGGT